MAVSRNLHSLWLCFLLGAVYAVRVEDDYTDWPQIKLVVNSNMKYQTPLKTLLDTMKAIRFERFEDVVVVVGGSDMERIYVDDGLTYLETQFENFDLTGLSMIWHYRDHPSIRAQAYMYVLDTSTVGPGFPQKFQSFAGTTYAEYRGLPRPASNVCVFGRGILEAYAENFDTPLTKQEGLLFEFGHQPQGVKQLEEFAQNVTLLRQRVAHGDPVDIYQTGYPRNSFWYPDFDLFKYILWGKYGDIEGKVRSLNRVFMYRRARRRRRESRSLIAKHASASVQRGAQFQHARVQHELAQPAQRALLVH